MKTLRRLLTSLLVAVAAVALVFGTAVPALADFQQNEAYVWNNGSFCLWNHSGISFLGTGTGDESDVHAWTHEVLYGIPCDSGLYDWYLPPYDISARTYLYVYKSTG